MGNGNWPHGPNFYQARKVRHWAGPGRPPPIGLPANELGLAPGTPVVFGGPEAMGYAQIQAARAQQRPLRSLTAAGMPGAPTSWRRHPGASPPQWAGRGEVQGFGPGAGQIGGEFSYVTDPTGPTIGPPVSAMGRGGPAVGPSGPSSTPTGGEQYTGAPQLSPCIGSPPEACPYIQQGLEPPPACAELIQFASEEARASYDVWWRRYYGEPGCDQGPPAIDTPGELVPMTVTEEIPESDLPPKRPPWGWIVGGTAAAGAVVAGVVYVLSRKKRRRG